LTDAQFAGYIAVENEAQVEDRVVAAMGTAAAIAQAFGGKGVKAMQAFQRGVGGDGSAVADSREMGELRRRIQSFVNLEQPS
jgi:hypothetical protein